MADDSPRIRKPTTRTDPGGASKRFVGDHRIALTPGQSKKMAASVPSLPPPRTVAPLKVPNATALPNVSNPTLRLSLLRNPPAAPLRAPLHVPEGASAPTKETVADEAATEAIVETFGGTKDTELVDHLFTENVVTPRPTPTREDSAKRLARMRARNPVLFGAAAPCPLCGGEKDEASKLCEACTEEVINGAVHRVPTIPTARAGLAARPVDLAEEDSYQAPTCLLHNLPLVHRGKAKEGIPLLSCPERKKQCSSEPINSSNAHLFPADLRSHPAAKKDVKDDTQREGSNRSSNVPVPPGLRDGASQKGAGPNDQGAAKQAPYGNGASLAQSAGGLRGGATVQGTSAKGFQSHTVIAPAINHDDENFDLVREKTDGEPTRPLGRPDKATQIKDAIDSVYGPEMHLLAPHPIRGLSPSADHSNPSKSADQEKLTQGLITEGEREAPGRGDVPENLQSLHPNSLHPLSSPLSILSIHPERSATGLTNSGNNNTGAALTNSLIKASELPSVEGRGKRLPVLSLSPREQELLAGVLDTPGAHCNDCPISGQCSEFLPGAECSIAPRFDGLSMRDPNNQVTRAVIIADMQFKRGMQAATVEQTKHPGVLEPMVTRQLEIAALADQRVRDLIAPPAPTSGGTTTLSLSQTTAPGVAPPDVLGAAIKAIVANRPKEIDANVLDEKPT